MEASPARYDGEDEMSAPVRCPRVLVVEDSREVRELVCALLCSRGLACDVAASVAEARVRLRAGPWDLLLLDVNLPDGSGLSLVAAEADDGPLVVVITGGLEIGVAIEALRRGAVDFITKPFSVETFLDRTDRLVEQWRARRRVSCSRRSLERLVRLKTDELSRTARHVDEVRDAAVTTLGEALNLMDHETGDHCRRVCENCLNLGSRLGLTEGELRVLRWGALLHDIGKIGVPERILLKRGPLDPAERIVAEQHPRLGHRMLGAISFLERAGEIVLHHHERYDGSGYPGRLRGDDISLPARIFAVMDTLDAMTSDRPYRSACAFPMFRGELERGAGGQFDPAIVAAFLRVPVDRWLVQGGGVAAADRR